MNIEFKNKKMAKLCNDFSRLQRKYGLINAEKISEVLNYMNCADCLISIPSSIRPHPLGNNLKGKFAVELKHPYRLIFEPVGEFIDSDYSTIKNVVITDLSEDYH